MSKMLVVWTFLPGTLLEETSSQIIIQSNFGRKAESGSGILRKEYAKLLGSIKHKNGILMTNSALVS